MNVFAAIDARLCPICHDPVEVASKQVMEDHLREHGLLRTWWFIMRVLGRLILIRLRLVQDNSGCTSRPGRPA